MSGPDPEKTFMEKAGAAVPGIPGYREPAARRETDSRLRGYLASRLDELSGKFGEIRAVAEEEGDVDMVDDLDRIAERIGRTAEALRSADYAGCAFFGDAAADERQLGRVCSYDTAMLEDLELLAADILSLKYEAIGTLTLREAEGTVASIELRIANRRDIFEMSAG